MWAELREGGGSGCTSARLKPILAAVRSENHPGTEQIARMVRGSGSATCRFEAVYEALGALTVKPGWSRRIELGREPRAV